MKKALYPLLTSLMARLVVLLFLFTWLSACNSVSNIPTAWSDFHTSSSESAVDDKTPGEKGLSEVLTPDGAGEFGCDNLDQIPSIECQALVTLYTNTHGVGWSDKQGWLVTKEPCSWYGIECSGGHVSGIQLGYNQLAGTLPSELGNLPHLRVLGLTANRLYGSIPAEVGNLSKLVSLEMGGNWLAGPLPVELGGLANLRSLSLGNNNLSGSIPATLGDLESLESLVLSHNQFGGAIPAELGNLVNLRMLILSHNKLRGGIPAALGHLSKLDELDLSYNLLSGAVPESVTHIVQRKLWGNMLEGTITISDQESTVVDYEGVHFSVDPSLAKSIWPEVIPATPAPEVLEGPSLWGAAPEHIRFTFADPGLPAGRQPMGMSLAAEAQILVYPLSELADIHLLVHNRMEALQDLLAEAGKVPAGELPLLPLTNAAQVFHAQAQYLVSGNILGLRFVSQHSQDPRPIMLSRELFYTFQGFTADHDFYLAIFFPLTTSILPDEVEVENWEAFDDHYSTYLSETTTLVDQLLPAEFAPDLTLLDAVVTSLQLEPDGVLSSTIFNCMGALLYP